MGTGPGSTNTTNTTNTTNNSDIVRALNKQSETNKELKDVIKDLSNKLEKEDKSKGKSSSSSRSSRSETSFRDSFDKRISSTTFTNQLTDFIETAVDKYGGMIDYGASELENRASIAIKLQAEKLTEYALDVGRFIGSKSIQQIFGSAHEARMALAEIYDANSYYLNKIAEDYNKSEDAGLEAMANSLVVQRALRINQQDFSKIIENQMASSKKVTSEVFEEIAFFAGEYSNRTSASIFQITNQLTRAVSDFDTFGGASVENLGKLAGFMGELRMDTESVAGLIKRLQSFEGSVGIVKDLAGAFGAVVDPAKLMGDAIRDPAEALNTIRQSLLDAGHTSESLGFKITLLADSLGVSSEAMRRFLDGNIDAQGVLQNSVKATEMSTEATNKTIANAQKQMVDTRTIAGNLQDILKTQAEVAFQSSFKTVRQFTTNINQFLTEQGSVLSRVFDNEGYAKAAENFNSYLYGTPEQRAKAQTELEEMLSSKKLTGTARTQADALLEQIKSGELRKDLDKELNEISKKRQRKVNVDIDINEEAITAGVDRINKSKELENFYNVMNNPFWYSRRASPSQWEKDTDANLKAIDDLFGKSLGKDSQIKAYQKETENLGVINVKLNDGDGEMSLTDFTDKMEEINSEIVRSNQALQNQAILIALNKINDNVSKETKYVANITNEGTYKVVLGKEFKSKVEEIAEKVVEETFKAVGIAEV